MTNALPTLVLVVLLGGLFFLALKTPCIKASGTIYIRADGNVEGTTSIQTTDNITYSLTSDISDSVVIERDNITLDGCGHSILGGWSGTGMDLSGRTNVTVKNVLVQAFDYGILLDSSLDSSICGNIIRTNFYSGIVLSSSSNNSISDNDVTNNGEGIKIEYSSNNSISGNNVAANTGYGILLEYSSNIFVSGNNAIYNSDGIVLFSSSNNSISGNDVTFNHDGIDLEISSNNSISGNRVAHNSFDGIYLSYSLTNRFFQNNDTDNNYGISIHQSLNNVLCHNNFINNAAEASTESSFNTWDDGYPSGGNYWSDYNGADLCRGLGQNETRSDGIGDTPYIIDVTNLDNYPLMAPWTMNVLTIHILTDGTVEPLGAPIVRRENLYTLTSSVAGGAEGIVIEKSDMTLDGGGFTVQGGSGWEAITLIGTRNVTVRNVQVFGLFGIGFYDSVNNTLVGNTIINNFWGNWLIFTCSSSNNSVYHNNFEGVGTIGTNGSINIWDNGCEGNYWSTGGIVDSNADGICDIPFTIDINNTDCFPLINPFWNPADINHDTKVDVKDIYKICMAYGSSEAGPNPTIHPWNPHCDINADDKVDVKDYYIACQNFGKRFYSGG